jgi:hypothetical protein
MTGPDDNRADAFDGSVLPALRPLFRQATSTVTFTGLVMTS